MKLIIGAMAIFVATTLLSCNKSATSDVDLKDIAKNKEEKFTAPMLAADSAAAKNYSGDILQSGNPALSPDWNKKIIKTANITLELKDYNSFNNNIHNTPKRYGAYIASEQQNQNDSKIENTISIKVPVDKFEDLVNSFSTEGVKLLEKKINTEDVTGEVVDTKARTEAKKQVREQYIGLLKKAKTMKDILEVQKEINSIQEDIEAGSGRVDFLSHEAAYSTINLTYFQYLNGNSDNAFPSFITKLSDAFKEGTSIITSLFLIIVTVWPLLFIVFAIWILIKKYSLKHVKPGKKEGQLQG